MRENLTSAGNATAHVQGGKPFLSCVSRCQLIISGHARWKKSLISIDRSDWENAHDDRLSTEQELSSSASKIPNGISQEIKERLDDNLRLTARTHLSKLPSRSMISVNGQRYQFQVQPFDMSMVPWLFTRITTILIGFAHLKIVRLQLDFFLSNF